MRTNIVLDEELVRQARQLTGIKTKKELIHQALKLMVRLGQQGQARQLRGKLHWEGDLNEQRQSRFQDEE